VVELVIVFASVRQLLSSFRSFLRGVSSFPRRPRAARLALPAGRERGSLLSAWRAAPVASPPDRTKSPLARALSRRSERSPRFVRPRARHCFRATALSRVANCAPRALLPTCHMCVVGAYSPRDALTR